MSDPSRNAAAAAEHTLRAFQRVGRACAAAVLLLGLAALLGWVTGLRALARVGPNFIPMAPNTALAFVALGAALWLLAQGHASRGGLWIAGGCAWLVGLLVLLRLVEMTSGHEFGIHRWLIAEPGESVGAAPVGRMSLPTALGLGCAVAAVLLRLAAPWQQAADPAATVCAALVLAGGAIFTLGYLYGAPFFYGAPTIPMALPSALAFLLLGAGLLAAAGPAAPPLREFLGASVYARLLRAFLPFTALAVCVVAWLTYLIGKQEGASSAALLSAFLVLAVAFVVSLFCARLAHTVGRELQQAGDEMRRQEEQSRKYAAELEALNATLERRVAERTAALEENRHRLEEYFTILTSLQDPHNIDKTFDLILRFCERLGYDQAILSLVDREANVVRAVKAVGTPTEVVNRTVRPLAGTDILAEVARQGRPAVIPDSAEDPRCDREAATAAGIRGQVVLPLICGEVVGTLQVASRGVLRPGPAELQKLEALGQEAARALAGLKQMGEIQRLNSELRASNAQLRQLADELAASANSEYEAREALRENEERLRLLLESSGQGVYGIGLDGRCTFLNKAAAAMLGCTPEQALGQDMHQLIHHSYADGSPYPVTACPIYRSFRQGYGCRITDEVFWRRDGTSLPVEYSSYPLVVGDGVIKGAVVTFTDITERQRAEEAVRESEARFRAVSQSANDAIISADSVGNIIHWNKGAQAIFGYAADEVLGRSLTTLMPECYRQFHQRGLDRVRQTGEMRMIGKTVELYGQRKDGSSFPLELSLSAWDTRQGKFFTGIARDITERKRVEEQLRVQNAQLQEAAESERRAHETLKQAQSQMVQTEKLAALGQLVAGVAHEINNPLSFVGNNVAVLQRDVKALRELLEMYQQADGLLAESRPDLAGRIRELAEHIDLAYTLTNLDDLMVRSRDGLKRIQQIVRDLRDFARLDESDLHEVDVVAGVESTLHIIRSRAKKQQVELVTDLQPLPPVVCYPAKVNQVVLNLVANAIDACGEGGTVTVRTRARDDGIEIHVADTGQGIDPGIRDKIFDPFFTTKPPGQGTGLGLSISYQIVQDHGGTISVESAPGRGAHFVVFLPFKPPGTAS